MSAWFTFDEPQFQLKGTTAPEIIQGQVGRALRFDGKQQFVEIPAETAKVNFGKGDFSIELWFRTKDVQTINVILDKRDSEGRGYHLYLFKGLPGAQVSDSKRPNNQIDNSSTLNDGKWHHFSVVAQRLPRKPIALFVDGKSYLAPTGHLVTLNNVDVPNPLFLGRHHPNIMKNETFYYAGDMDELTFYKRALKPDEIAAIYRAGKAGKCRVRR